MNNKIARITLFASKVNRQHIQFIFAILALAMLVLGIGIPLMVVAVPHTKEDDHPTCCSRWAPK